MPALRLRNAIFVIDEVAVCPMVVNEKIKAIHVNAEAAIPKFLFVVIGTSFPLPEHRYPEHRL